MFKRFTTRARRLIVHAQIEARRLRHDHIGTEHILLALVHENDKGTGALALEGLGISLDSLGQRIEDIIGTGRDASVGRLPFTPHAKNALALSKREASLFGHDYIGTEHLLLGMADESAGVAAQMLAALGADPDRVRRQVLLILRDR